MHKEEREWKHSLFLFFHIINEKYLRLIHTKKRRKVNVLEDYNIKIYLKSMKEISKFVTLMEKEKNNIHYTGR